MFDCSSIGTQAFLKTDSEDEAGKRIVKIFSRNVIDETFLKTLFLSHDAESIVRIPWQAYPIFNPPEQFAPVVLDDAGAYVLLLVLHYYDKLNGFAWI